MSFCPQRGEFAFPQTMSRQISPRRQTPHQKSDSPLPPKCRHPPQKSDTSFRNRLPTLKATTPPPHTHTYIDNVNRQAIRISLECILLHDFFLTFMCHVPEGLKHHCHARGEFSKLKNNVKFILLICVWTTK